MVLIQVATSKKGVAMGVYGSIDRQEHEFLACVIRQLPGLDPDDRQHWINNQQHLRDVLQSALGRDYRRECMLRLEAAMERRIRHNVHVPITQCLLDCDDATVDKVADLILELTKHPLD